jgi:hypothetical protein
MIIADFTKYELDLFRDECNFVGCERDIFDLRSQGIPLETIAESLNLSIDGTKRISRKVNSKINRVLSHF